MIGDWMIGNGFDDASSSNTLDAQRGRRIQQWQGNASMQISREEFNRGCRIYGYDGEGSSGSLFRALDVERSNYLSTHRGLESLTSEQGRIDFP